MFRLSSGGRIFFRPLFLYPATFVLNTTHSLHGSPQQILKQYWGYDNFRPLQRDIIDAVMQGHDTLALLPTGGGKSVCYQVPALAMKGMCLVISPLIALMQDQVRRLEQVGVDAACIHSGMHYNDVVRMLNDAADGRFRLLYVSPERIRTELFSGFLPDMQLNMVAVDEAHCISQWGHDFRPAYLQIPLVRDVHPHIPLLALTATATERVRTDIIEQAGMKKTRTFSASFARSNIFYEVCRTDNKPADVVNSLKAGCSIVYCRSRRLTETVGASLVHQGIATSVYHAGMQKDARDEAQQQWMDGTTKVMVATTAFGMGIDKPDVRQVVHYDAPEHLEAYYQEAGRAGRDGLPSQATLFYNTPDIRKLEASTELQYPPEEYLRRVYQAVVDYLQIPVTAQPDRYYDFDLQEFCTRFGLEAAQAIYALRLLDREGLWTMTESVYHPATVRFITDRYTLDALEHAHPTLSYISVGILRMYSGVFSHPVRIRETAVARQLRLSRDEVVRALLQMHDMELLEYNRPGEGPQLFFHHYRVDSRHLHIDMRRIAMLRKQHEERTAAMIGFLYNTEVCRERLILEYFGQQPQGDCGHCDICRNKEKRSVKGEDIQAMVLSVFKATPLITVNALLALHDPHIKNDILDMVRILADKGVLKVEGSVIRMAGTAG